MGRAPACGRGHWLQPCGAEVEGEGARDEWPVSAGMGASVPCSYHRAPPGLDTKLATCRRNLVQVLPCFSLQAAGLSLGLPECPTPPCPQAGAGMAATPTRGIPGSPSHPALPRSLASPHFITHPGSCGALSNASGQHCYLLLVGCVCGYVYTCIYITLNLLHSKLLPSKRK